MAAPDLSSDSLNSYITAARPEFEKMLGELVEVPTVSVDPERKADIARGAALAIQYLDSFGATTELVETPGNPVILGKMGTEPKNPTITIYNHIDVQPAQEAGWTREPFEFRIEDGHYLGRGATDDKGPALTALFAARYAVQNNIPVNINFIWELEEEIGSPNFEHFVKAKKSDLQTDSVLISDTVWLSKNIPAVPYGLRGLQGATFSLETGLKDAHSGLTGGAARNPIGELCQVIGRCYDASTGQVWIPGFYDDVGPIDEQELDNFLNSGFNVEHFMSAHGFKSLRTSEVAEVIQRIWCRPTFEVHGITGGYTGPGIKTVVPPKAEAKVSMRLVPNQDPTTVLASLRAFIAEVSPDVQVEDAGSLRPYVGQFAGPYADAAKRALLAGFGREATFTREGGSIGAVVTLQEHLQVPITFIGLSLPEHSYHGPNEYFDWGQASGGIRTLVTYISEVSTFPQV